ncbi:hypothetical protein D3C83_00900 [compost metagenome]
MADHAGRRRNGARDRRARRAADDSLLARRSAGTQRRAVARRVGPEKRSRRHPGARERAPRGALAPGGSTRDSGFGRCRRFQRCRRRGSSACLGSDRGCQLVRIRSRPRGGGGGTGCRLPRRRPARPRHDSDAGHTRVRAVLRRIGRHAARPARAVRQPHQPRLGAGAAQAVLPPVQLRAAGRRHRGCADAVARAAAFVPARGRLPLPPSGDRPRHPRPGVPRCAGVRDEMAMEHHDLAGRAAQPRRPQGRAAAAAHAGRRSDGRRVPRRRRMPREHSRRPRDSRSSAGRSDGARLPRRGNGSPRPDRGAGAHSPRRRATRLP